MTFEELKKLDKYGAFQDFVTFKTAKETELIPNDYENVFPNECTCGSENIITRKLTQPQCCNPRCKVKMGYSLAKMIKSFGCANIGEETCKSIIRDLYNTLKIPSHVEMLTLEPKDYPECLWGSRGFDYVTAIETINKQPLTFQEMISHLAIPEYDEDSAKIFDKIKGTEDLINKIKEAGSISSFLQYRGVYDPMKAFYLAIYLDDIAYAETVLFSSLRVAGLTKLHICITGNIRPYGKSMTKAQFKNLCNELCTLPNGFRPLEIEVNEAMTSNPYIIADYVSNTPKYLTGLNRQNGSGKKVLYTSTEFLEELKEVIGKCLTKVETQESSQKV